MLSDQAITIVMEWSTNTCVLEVVFMMGAEFQLGIIRFAKKVVVFSGIRTCFRTGPIGYKFLQALFAPLNKV